MEQNIEVYAKKGYALKGYALGGICLKGICLRGNMPNRFYALKGICLDTVKFYAKKGLCLKKLCPKGIMPYDSMPNYRQTRNASSSSPTKHLKCLHELKVRQRR